jgi:N-6 DNA Methylase
MEKGKQRAQNLSEFAAWSGKHIKGDEKGEAQIFLDHLFRALGYEDGLKGAGAELEMRVKKADQGTSFADLVCKPVVLIEMKKRGQDLSKHYRQAFDYWTRLVPGRPRYVILCNFDEFWIYDFETQMDTPVDKVILVDLPHRYGPLAFLFPEGESPIFGNHQETVTREAADKLAILFNNLITRHINRDIAQRFILQTLLALFSEDIGLLEQYFFAQLLDDCKNPSDSYDLLGGLFVEMNTPGKTTGGRFKGVDYFNGGLFANPARLELVHDEIEVLKEAARFDWSKVRPEIFGALFEHSMGTDERHAFGAHFTSPVDIMKIVGPTIVEPWRERIEAADTVKELNKLLTRIMHFKVLDPACGSGNFLYIAYREVKRLEARIYERLAETSKKIDPLQRSFGFVMARNFYGMDINPFAIELAKVTMMLAHKLAIDELHINETALPLDNLNINFTVGDALIQSNGCRTPWPKVDAIIGNPPFLGAKRLKPERGATYVNAVRKLYPEVPGMADYCVYWFRRAHDELALCTGNDPFTGRAGLVGTQNIRNNASRKGGLDYICTNGTVIEAVDNQPWSGEANVHVSIANWIKTQDEKLIPKRKKLWFKVDSVAGTPRRQRGAGPAHKDYELDCRDVPRINSALSDKADVSTAAILTCNQVSGLVCQGITPGHSGFVITVKDKDALIARSSEAAAVIQPYLIGDDILSGATRANRFIIDFGQRNIIEAQAFQGAFEHIQRKVLPSIQKAAIGESERSFSIENWWLHWRSRTELIQKISQLPRYLACSRVTKRPIFAFVASSVRPGDALQVFAFADDYSFGILQSYFHWLWFFANCSNMKSDPRYTSTSIFNTFPWPQAPKVSDIDAVAKASRELRQLRTEALSITKDGLRGLYRTLDLPGNNPLKSAHIALDEAVRKTYGFSLKGDPLEQILELNMAVAQRIEAGVNVTPPGVPSEYPDPTQLISSDCIRG